SQSLMINHRTIARTALVEKQNSVLLQGAFYPVIIAVLTWRGKARPALKVNQPRFGRFFIAN
ncbi:hypothetical protein OFC55_39530, partial [Escherichia coli]|nr:hypothetical protein [Escherichia coli]